MQDERKKLFWSPCRFEMGTIARAVMLPDGNAQVETWRDGEWVKGGVGFHEFLMASPMSLEERAEHGIPDDADPPDNPNW